MSFRGGVKTSPYNNNGLNDDDWLIGLPIPNVTGILPERFVWYKGSIVNISSYPKLFNIFGTKFGGDGVTTFGLPDLTGRVLQGAEEICNYLAAALPNIKATVNPMFQNNNASASGAFYVTGNGKSQRDASSTAGYLAFDASRSSSIYKNGVTTVQPPAFTVRYMTRYK